MMYAFEMDLGGLKYLTKFHEDRFRHLRNVTVIIATI
jgi:hypothetical protein